MEDVWFAISTGVISGAVSAALLFFFRTLIVGHLLPWYHDLVYRGINVDGRWFASEFTMAQDLMMNIRQRAGAISGDAQLLRRGESPGSFEDVREFAVEGRIEDRYLTLTLTHKNRQRLGVIAFLVEPICDGRQLQGVMSFVSMHGSDIDSTPIVLARDAEIVRRAREAIEMEMIQPSLPMPGVEDVDHDPRVKGRQVGSSDQANVEIK